jgi:uncharacterized protein (TIGR02246 family)
MKHATTMRLLPLLLCAACAGAAPPPMPPGLHTRPASTPDDLFRAIAAEDAALFDAYNRCDLEKFASFFVPDVEFYHDHGGVTLGRDALTESVRKNICGTTTRELVADSLEVYPMDNYGALEIGTHLFHHPKAEDTEPVGVGKFVQLWHYDKAAGTWQITRVISFDHHPVTPR